MRCTTHLGSAVVVGRADERPDGRPSVDVRALAVLIGEQEDLTGVIGTPIVLEERDTVVAVSAVNLHRTWFSISRSERRLK